MLLFRLTAYFSKAFLLSLVNQSIHNFFFQYQHFISDIDSKKQSPSKSPKQKLTDKKIKQLKSKKKQSKKQSLNQYFKFEDQQIEKAGFNESLSASEKSLNEKGPQKSNDIELIQTPQNNIQEEMLPSNIPDDNEEMRKKELKKKKIQQEAKRLQASLYLKKKIQQESEIQTEKLSQKEEELQQLFLQESTNLQIPIIIQEIRPKQVKVFSNKSLVLYQIRKQYQQEQQTIENNQVTNNDLADTKVNQELNNFEEGVGEEVRKEETRSKIKNKDNIGQVKNLKKEAKVIEISKDNEEKLLRITESEQTSSQQEKNNISIQQTNIIDPAKFNKDKKRQQEDLALEEKLKKYEQEKLEQNLKKDLQEHEKEEQRQKKLSEQKELDEQKKRDKFKKRELEKQQKQLKLDQESIIEKQKNQEIQQKIDEKKLNEILKQNEQLEELKKQNYQTQMEVVNENKQQKNRRNEEQKYRQNNENKENKEEVENKLNQPEKQSLELNNSKNKLNSFIIIKQKDRKQPFFDNQNGIIINNQGRRKFGKLESQKKQILPIDQQSKQEIYMEEKQLYQEKRSSEKEQISTSPNVKEMFENNQITLQKNPILQDSETQTFEIDQFQVSFKQELLQKLQEEQTQKNQEQLLTDENEVRSVGQVETESMHQSIISVGVFADIDKKKQQAKEEIQTSYIDDQNQILSLQTMLEIFDHAEDIINLKQKKYNLITFKYIIARRQFLEQMKYREYQAVVMDSIYSTFDLLKNGAEQLASDLEIEENIFQESFQYYSQLEENKQDLMDHLDCLQLSLKEIFKGRIKTKELGKEILQYEIFILQNHLEIEVFNVVLTDLLVKLNQFKIIRRQIMNKSICYHRQLISSLMIYSIKSLELRRRIKQRLQVK